jgi:hypothetical protein
MPISLVGTTVGPSDDSTSTTINIPTGTAVGQITIATAINQATNPVTIPSGWTPLVNIPGFAACYRICQSGDPSSITFSTTAVGWWESLAVTYSGVDATSPIDDFNSCATNGSTTSTSIASYYAPSVSPAYANDTLVCIYAAGGSNAGSLWTLPSGLTSVVATAGGPLIQVASKTLTTAAPTGTQIATNAQSRAGGQYGVQIALKTAGDILVGATAQTTLAGIDYTETGFTATFSANLTYLNAQTGDLVVVLTNLTGPAGDVTVTGPAGYTLATSLAGAVAMFTHTFTSGDSTSPTFTYSSTLFFGVTVLLFRSRGASGTAPALDTSAITSGGAGSVTSSSLTPASSEFFLCYFINPTSHASTWTTLPTGFTDDPNSGGGPSVIAGWKELVASSTGSFTAVNSAGTLVAVIAALFGLGSGPPPPVLSQRFLACGLI